MNHNTTSTTEPNLEIIPFLQKNIDFSNGINTFEFLLLAMIGFIAISRIVPLITIGKKTANALTYVSKEELKNIKDIENTCYSLMAISQCDRVFISFFHNGSTDILGLHHKKSSVYFEVSRSLASIKDKYQNVPIDRIKDVLALLTNDYQHASRSPDNTVEDSFLDRLGIEAKDEKLIKLNGKNVGALSLHYLNAPSDNHWLQDKKQKQEISYYTNILESQLENLIYPNQPRWKRFLTGIFKGFTTDD